MEKKSEFSKFLKNYIDRHDYTLESFADEVGYSFSLIGHYINGRRYPSFRFIKQFFKRCNLDDREKIEVIAILQKDNLQEEFKGIDVLLTPDYVELDSRGRKQLNNILRETTLMFNDENISEEDKDKMMLAIQEAFIIAKQKNKRK